MANDFDPLKKNTVSNISEALNAQVPKDKTNTADDLLNSFLTNSVHNQINSPVDQPSQAALYNEPSSIYNTAQGPIRSTNSFDGNVRTSLPQDVVSKSKQRQVNIIEQQTKPYWEHGEGSSEDWNQDQSEEYRDESGDTSADYYDEYYNDQLPYKKKGLSAKVDRLVRRFPALGVLYKQPSSSSSSFDKSGSERGSQSFERSDSVNRHQSAHEIAADKLALNERYSDKLRTQIVNLPSKDETQPVDVRIHHEKNNIYSCDIGRSIVEIFDMNGKVQHVINDSIMSKFQPTAVAVAFDGTIITGSHFHHRLHMYSPGDSQNENYKYKQFKLGTPGNAIHEFNCPAGIAIDRSDGYLYVCDRGNYRIQVMRPEGICERVIELFVKNKKKKFPLDPVRIAHQKNSDQIVCIVGNGDAICFISKQANGRTYVDPIYILDENGFNLEGASGLAVDSHDRIFISDTGHHRIVICTPEGDYITSFGTPGDEPGQLKRPCGLDIADDGTVVVTDAGNKRLQLFGTIREQVVVENIPPPPPPPPPEYSNELIDTEREQATFL